MFRLLLLVIVPLGPLLTACGHDPAPPRTPGPSTSTYYCGSYESTSPGTIESDPPC